MTRAGLVMPHMLLCQECIALDRYISIGLKNLYLFSMYIGFVTFSQERNTSSLSKQLQWLQKYLQTILQWSKDKGSLFKAYKCVQSAIYELENILKLWREALSCYQQCETMIEVNTQFKIHEV